MSFLKNFMTWNEGTEVPDQYYFWSGISALAAIVNGRVWINMGRYEIFPNMYIVLLGPPATGKTSAMRRAEEIVRTYEDISVSAQSETPEGLVRFLRDKCVRTFDLSGVPTPYTPVTCFLSELSNFFSKDAQGMIDLLTGVWDCGGKNFHRRTKGQGEDMLPRPNINLIACTTQDWITTYLKSDIIGGGFTRRVNFINETSVDDTKRVPWPQATPEQMRARDACLTYGQVLKSVAGEMQYGPGARGWWDHWYCSRTISQDYDVRGYHKSKPTLLLKVATLVALSKEPKLMVSIEDFEVGLALLDRTEVHLAKVFQGIGRNELNVIAQKVLGYLENTRETVIDHNNSRFVARVMNEKQLRGLMYRDAPGRELEDILAHLVMTEKVKRIQTLTNPPRTMIALSEGWRPA